MRKLEIKEIGIVSAFKTTLYILSIPLAFMALIGLLFTVLGAVFSQQGILFIGLPYLILPLFMLGIYGLISMLAALVYNKFSSKFGGLEIVVSEKNDQNFIHNSNQYPNPNQNIYPPAQ